MSCSNFAFKPFNFQTGRKCLPLLVFKFCPCIGHIWTHFLPFGQRKSGRLKAGKRTERAGCTNVHKAKLRERKAFSRQGRCEYFGTRQAAVFQTHSRFQPKNHLKRTKSFCPVKLQKFRHVLKVRQSQAALHPDNILFIS